MHTGTYSPEDNKLRLYPESRLSPTEYQRVKAAGFAWAPKQELFVAPMWTPAREDLLLEMCGEIGDEDKSLCERAEERADRFDEYSEKRARDAACAKERVDEIAGGIPLGQPILVGHHSEARARKDAERIEGGMRRAVKLWDQAQYWKDRAEGAIRAAKYKERSDVRARRIKKLEAEERKMQRNKAETERQLRFWRGEMHFVDSTTGERKPLAICSENRRIIMRYLGSDPSHMSFEFPLSKYPRQAPASQYEGAMCLWTALGCYDGEECAVCTLEQARELALASLERSLAWETRWLAHYTNRLTYERAMLADGGGTIADRTRPEVGGACRCWASPGFGRDWAYIVKVNRVSVTIRRTVDYGDRAFNQTMPFDKLAAVMTKAQVDEARSAGLIAECKGGVGFVLLTETPPVKPTAPKPAEASEFAAMRETLKAGVQVVSAKNLFATPKELAFRVAELAECCAGDKVLEPSAGTGRLIDAMVSLGVFRSDVTAVEINQQLAEALESKAGKVICSDFLACNGNLGKFDAVIMNPPFDHGSDIAHILHARGFLNDGGRLVAICANGPRQQAELQPLADEWIPLEPGAFKESGASVNAAICVISV